MLFKRRNFHDLKNITFNQCQFTGFCRLVDLSYDVLNTKFINCDFVYLNPRPNESEIVKYYTKDYHPFKLSNFLLYDYISNLPLPCDNRLSER